MKIAMKELLASASRQHSVVTDSTMRALGISVAQRRIMVRNGLLERLLDGSYRLPGTPLDELARCVAACARPSGLVVCGPTAGRLWGLRRMPRDGIVHVIAPPASNPTVEPWLRPYRTALLDRGDIVVRADGIRVTSPSRTAVDLTRHLAATDLRSVVDQLIHECRGTVSTMRAIAEPLATPGRPWARRFLRELDKMPTEAVAESHWESRVVAAIIERGIDLEPQRWLEVPHWGPIRLDGCVAELQWGVEVDVFPDHFTEEGVTKDAGRDLACDAIGWCVSRVTGLGLRRDFTGEMDALERVYRHRLAEHRRRPAS
jgi:hypothetical protein